jgi:hypothetical protein
MVRWPPYTMGTCAKSTQGWQIQKACSGFASFARLPPSDAPLSCTVITLGRTVISAPLTKAKWLERHAEKIVR